jgi:hypothetical protein
MGIAMLNGEKQREKSTFYAHFSWKFPQVINTYTKHPGGARNKKD